MANKLYCEALYVQQYPNGRIEEGLALITPRGTAMFYTQDESGFSALIRNIGKEKVAFLDEDIEIAGTLFSPIEENLINLIAPEAVA